MLNRRRKQRPAQDQVKKVLLATARLLLESPSYKVPLTPSTGCRKQPIMVAELCIPDQTTRFV
ncbi:hypothetical protein L1D54_23595 [Vibrio brasiliensis]|uniref:hypothetical protein n=1 Tax=Vibrio brasiliensis TaxID=170652 RepID=UPI001EFC3FB9|nr:hypothetical protein [Vibrio brasiliensis]MCG9753426.1 hypothetical protein [Vibrio brasiliensis]